MSFDIQFENPQKLPLHELTFHVKDNGVKLVVPALSKKWVEDQRHIKYLPINRNDMDEEFVDKWLKTTKWFNNTLERLLEMEHYRFWSNLVFEPDYMATIVSFLQEAIPAYIPITSITTNEQIIELYSKVVNNVLIILCRAITNKESETEWMPKEQLADILYDKFIITIPMIFDLLVVYGPENSQIVRRILGTVLSIQPKYRNDMKESLNFLAITFNTKLKEKVNENNPDTYEDLVMYVLDCSYTIYSLVVVLPDAMNICREVQLEQHVTHFYDEAIPFLYKNIKYINPELLIELNRGRIFLIKFYRHFIDKYLQEALQQPDKKRAAAEELLNILQISLSDPNFVSDYQRLHPVTDDIETLTQVVPKLDKMKIDFIVKAFTTGTITSTPKTKSVKQVDSPSTSLKSKTSDASEIDIQSVLDVLPHLEVAFVRKLLSRYEDTESAIAAVLEGNLPPDLIDSDPSTTGNKVESMVEHHAETIEPSISATEDQEIAYIKSKSQNVRPKAQKRFLDDKSAIKEFHARNIEYGYVADEYDDEYDDSYDAMVDSESKTKGILKKTGAINELVDEVDDSEESDSSDEITGTREQRDRTRDFCENPEVARERWARNREAKYGNKRPSKPSGDVVGKPKGQGQEKSTLINRVKKTENKSSRANHNRRQGAAFKRNRGMIPS